MLKYYMNKNGYGGDWAQLAKDLDADITQTNAAEWIKGGPRDYFTWIQSTLVRAAQRWCRTISWP